MEHRDLHALTQLLLNIEALGRFDIFQVNTAEGRFQRGDHVNQLVRIEFIDFDIEHVNTGKLLKQNPFTFHDRLTGQRTDIPQPQHRGAVGDHRHQVTLGGIFISGQRIGGNFQTGGSHTRRIGQGQIALRR
ncbi:hypothetical protein D3C79_691830 [compost metagenome]